MKLTIDVKGLTWFTTASLSKKHLTDYLYNFKIAIDLNILVSDTEIYRALNISVTFNLLKKRKGWQLTNCGWKSIDTYPL